MKTNYQVRGIEQETFKYLFQLEKNDLSKIGAVKMRVDENPGFPCRVSLKDVAIGEEVILFTYEHHAVDSPYRSKGPIFIRKNAQTANLGKNEIPSILKHRLLSLRVYDRNGMMINAKTVKGDRIEEAIQNIFKDNLAQYIQVHNASPGCYNCQIDRID